MADELTHIIEYAKGLSDPVKSGAIEQFGRESDVVAACPFKTAPQGVNAFYRETAEAQVGFRALNTEPEISGGKEERFQDQCYPISGLLEVDRIIRKRHGDRRQVTNIMSQMKNASRIWTDTFINGNNASDPRVFDGMKNRLVADANGNVDGSTDDSRLIANSTASGGGALSLAKLDLALDLTAYPTHILMSRRMLTKFKAAARDPSLTNQQITDDYESDLGRRVTRFQGIPILTGYEPSKASTFLPFNEVAYGGGSATTTSLYVVSFREDGICGIQTSEPDLIPVTTDRGVFERHLYEWDSAITREDFYSGLRLSSVADAAIAA